MTDSKVTPPRIVAMKPGQRVELWRGHHGRFPHKSPEAKAIRAAVAAGEITIFHRLISRDDKGVGVFAMIAHRLGPDSPAFMRPWDV